MYKTVSRAIRGVFPSRKKTSFFYLNIHFGFMPK